MTRRRHLAAVLVALSSFACDDSNPTAPQSVQAATSTSGASVQICGATPTANNCPALAGSLELGKQLTVYVLVTLTASQAGISTTLGDFGTDNGGNAIKRPPRRDTRRNSSERFVCSRPASWHEHST